MALWSISRSLGVLLLGSMALAAAASEPPEVAASPLTAVTWRLVGFKGGDDRTFAPDDRTRYTLRSLLADAGIYEYEPEPAP